MTKTPIVLVPGWWLGAWAWDEVGSLLRADGYDVTALTLPGLEAFDSDRSRVTFDDHVQAICDALEAAGRRAVVVVHSGAGAPGYAASDRCPDKIAAMVYVDTGPAIGPLEPEFEGVEFPFSMDRMEQNENLDGISEAQKAEWAYRAVPEPGEALRGSAQLTNDARLDIPTTAICTAFPAAEYQEYAKQGMGFLAGYNELRNIDWIDLPTSHWPMWSKPRELAEIIGRVASAAS